MVRHERVIHLLAVSKAPLFAVLSTHVRARALVRWWTAVPPNGAVRPGDAIVVDLLDGGPPVQAALMVPALQHAKAWLVTGTNAVAPAWLDFAIQGGDRLVRCQCTTAGFDSLITSLQSELRGPSLDRIAALVVEHEPRFAAMAGIVRALVEHPWEARHPGLLATLAAIPLTSLRSACLELGFHRVEHFVTAVRLIAMDQLLVRHRLPERVARRLVGLADASNVHEAGPARQGRVAGRVSNSCVVWDVAQRFRT